MVLVLGSNFGIAHLCITVYYQTVNENAYRFSGALISLYLKPITHICTRQGKTANLTDISVFFSGVAVSNVPCSQAALSGHNLAFPLLDDGNPSHSCHDHHWVHPGAGKTSLNNVLEGTSL